MHKEVVRGIFFDNLCSNVSHMHFKKQLVFLFLFVSNAMAGTAQTKTERAGWLFLSARQKLNSKWSVSADLQARSTDQFRQLTVVLLRPGLVYNITEKQSATLGYTYFGTWDHEADNTAYMPEHRIWEQYQIDNTWGKVKITNRFRLEQRFIQKEQDVFSQRFRYSIRNLIPLSSAKDFLKGPYLVAQNEIFFNVQNKNVINQKIFDQNRLYGAVGYRLSKQWDLEAGYMYRYQIEDENNRVSHILQLALYADL